MDLNSELNRCRPWIEAALEYSGGTHYFEDIVEGIVSGRIVDMDESAVQFAKNQGCTSMTIAGRKGWARVLKSKKWTEAFTTLSKEI